MFLVFDTQKSDKCKIIYRFSVKYLAEREGFEPNFISKKIGYNTLVLILRVIFRVIKTKKATGAI